MSQYSPLKEFRLFSDAVPTWVAMVLAVFGALGSVAMAAIVLTPSLNNPGDLLSRSSPSKQEATIETQPATPKAPAEPVSQAQGTTPEPSRILQAPPQTVAKIKEASVKTEEAPPSAPISGKPVAVRPAVEVERKVETARLEETPEPSAMQEENEIGPGVAPEVEETTGTEPPQEGAEKPDASGTKSDGREMESARDADGRDASSGQDIGGVKNAGNQNAIDGDDVGDQDVAGNQDEMDDQDDAVDPEMIVAATSPEPEGLPTLPVQEAPDQSHMPGTPMRANRVDLCPPQFELYFDTGSSQPMEASRGGELTAIKAWLVANRNAMVLIEGHTDAKGDEEHNLRLSYERALAVFKLLAKMGVDERQLLIQAKGETDPATGLHPFSSLNRRVVLRLGDAINCREIIARGGQG